MTPINRTNQCAIHFRLDSFPSVSNNRLNHDVELSLVCSTRDSNFHTNYPRYEPHRFMETLREKEKLLVTSNFSFSLNDLYIILSKTFLHFYHI